VKVLGTARVLVPEQLIELVLMLQRQKHIELDLLIRCRWTGNLWTPLPENDWNEKCPEGQARKNGA
jgi:hypothetical protein